MEEGVIMVVGKYQDKVKVMGRMGQRSRWTSVCKDVKRSIKQAGVTQVSSLSILRFWMMSH